MGIDCVFVLLISIYICHYSNTMIHSLFVHRITYMICSQGTIVWERWQLEEFLQARKRVCHVSNVCWANGRLTLSCPLFRPPLSRSRCKSARMTIEPGTSLNWQATSCRRYRRQRALEPRVGTACCICTRSRR
jgi:hypothetical protein